MPPCWAGALVFTAGVGEKSDVAGVAVLLVPTDEKFEIARQTVARAGRYG